ncbi:MAG: hypothetical protein SD837_07860 [Candidatus Electrothrix scaldis]|nr:MAG: hypothetical protein SD837_07860 [Candidatus Electrothrix sp. GW3-3]
MLNSLFENYNLEGFPVAYTMKDFQKDYVRNHLGLLSPDEVLDRFSPDDRLKGLSLNDRLKGLSQDEIQLYLKKLSEKSEK